VKSPATTNSAPKPAAITRAYCAAKEREIKKLKKKFFGGVNLNEPQVFLLLICINRDFCILFNIFFLIKSFSFKDASIHNKLYKEIQLHSKFTVG
jgi:hypothetical protein